MEFNSILPTLPNVSLVAFYGHKPVELTHLIQQLQNYLLEKLKEQFQPYQLEQIHGTIIGYEGVKTDKGILNQWFLQHRNEQRYIDIPASINYIRNTNQLPITIRFGGYDQQSLYERSFQFINDLAVLRGWPFKNEQLILNMARLRLEFQDFNLLHKYHPKANSLDNDFYLRLGVLKVKPSDEKIKALENEVRNQLKANFTIYISVDLDSLSFVGYQEPSLPVETTQAIPFKEVNSDQIELLYS